MEVLNVEKKRLEFIDLAKGFCIFLVVFHHIASTWGLDSYPLKNMLTSFRMPLYFFLSGLFFKTYEGFGGFVMRKINKLLVPFVFFFITLSCILPNVLAAVNFRKFPPADVWLAFIWQKDFPNLPIWFLLSLFFSNIIFYGITVLSKKISLKYNLQILIALSCIIGFLSFFMGQNNLQLPMFLDVSCTSLPFFAAGHFAFRHTKILQENKKPKYFLIIFAAVCFIVVYKIASGEASFVQNKFEMNILKVYASGILGTLAIVFLAKSLGKLPVFTYFGRYSIMILVTHGWVLWFFIKIYRECFLWKYHLHFSDFINLTIIFIVTLLSYFLWIPLMRTFLPKVTAQKDLIKIKP